MSGPAQRLRIPYAPNPGQLAFHQDRYTFQERALFCGTGGGKTIGGFFEAIDWSLENPAGTMLIGEPTIPMIKKALYPAWRIVTGAPLGEGHPLVSSWNESDRHLVLRNGWDIWFVSTEDPTNIEGPPEVDLVWLDEARVVKRFAGEDGAWSQLTRRLRGSPLRPRRRGAILTTHSPSRQIDEVFRDVRTVRYHANGPDGEAGSYRVSDCADPQRRRYQWSTLDAVAWGTLARADGERIAAGFTGDARLRVIDGVYARSSGLVFDALDYGRNVRPAPPGEAERMSYGVDWGWSHPAVLTAHAWRGDRVHTIRELVMHRASDETLFARCQDFMERHGHGTFWCGPDKPEAIDKFRRAGLDARAYKGKVEDGVDRLNSRLLEASWLIDPGCVELLRSMDSWERDRESGAVKKQGGDDDAPDSARYGIMGEGRVEAGGVW